MARFTTVDNNQQYELRIFLEKTFDVRTDASIISQALKDAAADVAKKWAKENADKIYERLNIDAISNMMMADLSAQIASKYSGVKNGQ